MHTLSTDTSNTLTMSASTHGNEGMEYPNKRARAGTALAPDSRRSEPAAPVGFVEVLRIETLEREVRALRTAAEVNEIFFLLGDEKFPNSMCNTILSNQFVNY
jgi:hypothetical protein